MHPRHWTVGRWGGVAGANSICHMSFGWLRLSPLGPSPDPRRTGARNCIGRGNTIAARIIVCNGVVRPCSISTQYYSNIFRRSRQKVQPVKYPNSDGSCIYIAGDGCNMHSGRGDSSERCDGTHGGCFRGMDLQCPQRKQSNNKTNARRLFCVHRSREALRQDPILREAH